MLLFGGARQTTPTLNLCVVRLTTNTHNTERGISHTKSINVLKRQSKGYNILQEDKAMFEALEVYSRIVNVGTVEDGLYSLEVCNEVRDYETNSVEDYDYILVPHTIRDSLNRRVEDVRSMEET